MHKLFPDMTDRPENEVVFAGIAYCIVPYLALPFFMIFFLASAGTEEGMLWLEVIYYVANGLAAVMIFRHYLLDALLIMRFQLRRIFSTVATCVMLMLLFGFLRVQMSESGYMLLTALPVADTGFMLLPIQLIEMQPVAGILCMVLLAPLVVTCLFYATSFCPACYEKRWMGYIAVALFILVPHLIRSFTFYSNFAVELQLYLQHLPIHLIACWGYQKTDSVLTPIISLSLANLLGSLYMMLIIAG